MDSITLAIVLCRRYVQAVEYILDDQTIIKILSKCVVVSLIFTNYHSLEKEAVVSVQHCNFGHCTLLDICAGS